jgi:hypothetical protein
LLKAVAVFAAAATGTVAINHQWIKVGIFSKESLIY